MNATSTAAKSPSAPNIKKYFGLASFSAHNTTDTRKIALKPTAAVLSSRPVTRFQAGGSPMTGRSHDDFDLAAGRFVGLDRSQDAIDRVREIAIELIFKLPVPQNGKYFGHERQF